MMATLALLTASLLATSPALGTTLVIDATTQLDARTQLELELPTPPSLGDLVRAQNTPEILQGFDTVLLTQINALFGSENLPVANGGPVEPGVYVTVSPQQLLIFDTKIADMQDGLVPPGPASRECKSGCKASLWSAFREVWLRSLEEAQTYVLEIPARVLFAAEASVPAKTLVELSYAAAETRPGEPPSFALLVNGRGRRVVRDQRRASPLRAGDPGHRMEAARERARPDQEGLSQQGHHHHRRRRRRDGRRCRDGDGRGAKALPDDGADP